tara:strand:- start:117 stop:512 length:396 start_codon:yes stop_codon:yes gene_type:complete
MTNLLEQANLERLAEQAVGHYGWLLLAAFAALMGKDVLVNFVQGLLVYWGSDFDNDEILYISGRQARVIRLGLTSTTFFMTDRETKMIVPNCQLKQLTVEKKLPHNGGHCYLPKGSEIGPMQVEVVQKCKK